MGGVSREPAGAPEDHVAGASVRIRGWRDAVRPGTYRGRARSSRWTANTRLANAGDQARGLRGTRSLRDRGLATRRTGWPVRAPRGSAPEVTRASVPDAGHQPSERSE